MSAPSIIPGNEENRCHYCGRYVAVPHQHHIFGGPNRKISDKTGLWVWLCPEHHNMSDHSIHFDSEIMDEYHRLGQKAWEDRYIETSGEDQEKARTEFMKLFGRNYIY